MATRVVIECTECDSCGEIKHTCECGDEHYAPCEKCDGTKKLCETCGDILDYCDCDVPTQQEVK